MDNQRNTGPRDVFLHILSTLLLYVGIFAFGNLLFQLININFPDVLNDNFFSGSQAASLRWPLSFLVITFPVYLWLAHYIARDIEKDPEKKNLRTRRWLIHFTLFASAVAILVDLVTLVYRFLGGELTNRFLLKVLVVLFMAAAIFVYYRWILNNTTPALKDKKMRIFVGLVVLIVFGFLVYGFVQMGSPFAERLRRLDSERIYSLDSIQRQVVNHWQTKEELPASLEDMENPLSGYMLPTDPETGESYEYNILGPLTFELCATFQTSNLIEESAVVTRSYYDIENNWRHDVGRTCFEREIDPDDFPLLKDSLIEFPRSI